MSISETQALAILEELIRKPETAAEDIPRIWSELLSVYNKAFAPPVEEPKKKRRKRPANPNIGWPAGVSRQEFKTWKEHQLSIGNTENVNPQEYKRRRDLGESAISPVKPKAASKKSAK